MFRDREDAGLQLAERFKGRALKDPLVLAIPRGGVVTGAVLARALGAELDIVLARKLRAPYQHELAVGALGEDGEVYLSDFARGVMGVDDAYLARERAHQTEEIAKRRERFRAVRPAAEVAGRSVIVVDDGVATGSTMLAALHVLKARHPYELIVAVPVAPPETVDLLARYCDEVECLLEPAFLGGISAFYGDFTQVEDAEALRLLSELQRPPGAATESKAERREP
ncbi:phosphoribosyltransferase [Azoarcus sp. KH32C]|uniref:phosphoribosyltransferase n=1 Tax=Azoarcus sp. KH32C TaxID=748247 RepID=UPI0002386B38|nr:phosphoribosyltransferase family protein [Azoarcus sp. KH32C]BAL23819.1 putative phosphoribosyltransferase [Azoarcus sp. KH32C]